MIRPGFVSPGTFTRAGFVWGSHAAADAAVWCVRLKAFVGAKEVVAELVAWRTRGANRKKQVGVAWAPTHLSLFNHPF